MSGIQRMYDLVLKRLVKEEPLQASYENILYFYNFQVFSQLAKYILFNKHGGHYNYKINVGNKHIDVTLKHKSTCNMHN